MSRITLLTLSLVLLALACGDDDGGSPTTDGGEQDSGGGGACPNLAGSWTITEHCGGAPLIGMTVPVTQNGCDFTTAGAFPGFVGTITADGNITFSGVANGTTIDCTGTATETRITETCTGNCDVVLTK